MDDQQYARLDQWIEDQGLTMDVVFVPFNHSRHAGEGWECINWSVVIRGRNGAALTTTHAQGIGCIPGFKSGAPRTMDVQQVVDMAIHIGKHRQGNGSAKPLPAPLLRDVLYSLVMDSSAVDMTFDEWCGEYGYDTDSRKAEATYNECRGVGIRLSRMVDLHEARERFADY